MEELCDDDEVFLVVEVVNEIKATLLIKVVGVGTYDPEDLNFVKGLVEKVLLVLDDLHANHPARLHIDALHRAREGGSAQVAQHPVARGDDTVERDGKFLCLLEACPAAFIHDSQGKGVVDGTVQFHRVERVCRCWVPALGGLPTLGWRVLRPGYRVLLRTCNGCVLGLSSEVWCAKARHGVQITAEGGDSHWRRGATPLTGRCH
mmetsp:Transcript_44125/g.140545  ORF Transcript_44125/g.140545 Transcript_44125/m.140545 type:complete len:205 (-) Transcript_44125:1017-1631(-)